MHAQLLVIVVAAALVVVVLALLPGNRRALHVALASGAERRRVWPYALSLTALLAGPLAPVLAIAVLVVVRRRAGRGDPLADVARMNAVVALGLALLVAAAGLLLFVAAPRAGA